MSVLALSAALLAVAHPRTALSQTTAATPEARLVGALSLLDSRRGAEALDELRAVVGGSPSWETARLALASTLLRRGLFAEAGSEYVHIVGQSTVSAIENGDGTEIELTPAQLEALFGMAICRDEDGAIRPADRLYRDYADRMGLTSPDAARAFYRLASMLERTDVPWGDADAARARAFALDPDIERAEMLPPLPDPATDPRTEPYTRPIEFAGIAPSPGDTEVADDDTTDQDTTAAAPVPPALATYMEPWPETGRVNPAAAGDTLRIELLVNADGAVEDVRIDDCDSIGCGALVDLTFAAAHWSFVPATVDGRPVPARILFPVPHDGEPAAPGADESESARETPGTDGGPGADEERGPGRGRGANGGKGADEGEES